MNNEQVMKNFLQKKNGQTNLRDIQNGYFTYKGRTLYTKQEGNEYQLINYSTKIAYIVGNNLYLNIQKYSSTTSHIQYKLNYLASNTNYKITKYFERGE